VDEENMAYKHNRYYSALKKNQTVLFSGKWVEVEIKKNKHHVF
jgi:hypothetical protein